MRLSALTAAFLALAGAGCSCKQTVTQVSPSLSVTPVSGDFGVVAMGAAGALAFTLEAHTSAPVTLTSVTVEPASAGFTLGSTPTQVEGNAQLSLPVNFAPPAVGDSAATLVISSNDPEHPTLRVALIGQGATPQLELTTACAATSGCTGSATARAIDFGAEPTHRASPIPVTKLPTVTLVNAGLVPLQVTKAQLSGTDAAAFSFGGAAFPASGQTLAPQEGVSLSLRFVPPSEQQTSYAATLVVESDDPQQPRVEIALTGTLLPNQAPVVCANLTRVVPQAVGEPPRDYGTPGDWASLLTPPAQGYDLRASRDVRPGELVQLSALSSTTDASTCTFDPEDGRTGLSWQWAWVSVPTGAAPPALSGQGTAQVQLRPIVTGEYQLSLTVTDTQGRSTPVSVRFAVAIKQDLVAQLEWAGFAGVDLDLHLVRPNASSEAFAGAFEFFQSGSASQTSGDLNGFAVRTKASMPGSAFDFEWGQPGSADDPTLNVDDTGSGPLLENASLNFPEHDPACATGSCTYRVFVHYFKDGRTLTPAACVVDGGTGCRDGEACGCATTERCVAASAPAGDAGVGAGKCYPAPAPVVRLFFGGSATPAAEIPLPSLSPPDALLLGAPCQMLHVADVHWPSQAAFADGGTPVPTVTVPGADGSGRVVTPDVARFGVRAAGGSLQCSPDTNVNGVAWYAREP
jgi:hypothetical protein